MTDAAVVAPATAPDMTAEENDVPQNLKAMPGMEDLAEQLAIGDIPDGEHALQTPWSFFFDKKEMTTTPQDVDADEYAKRFKKLATFSTVEGFWRAYSFIERPGDLSRDSNLHLFRGELMPLWENFPKGGCWILKLRRTEDSMISKKWEELVSLRNKEDVLSVWNRDNSNGAIRFRICERLKDVLGLPGNTIVEYKNMQTSLRDRSSFRNAKAYMLVDSKKDDGSDENQGA